MPGRRGSYRPLSRPRGRSRDPAPHQGAHNEELESLLARLPEAQADALRLRFFGELKFQEIADAMGCSLATAKNRVRWGLTTLSSMMQSEVSNLKS